MAKFEINARIVVEGSDIRSRKAALNELQVMLDDYDDMNSDMDGSVTIHIDSIKKVK